MRNSSEISVLRLKPKASRLLLPTISLALVSFALAFVADQFSRADYEIALIAGAGVVILFWAFPMLSYLGGYLRLTDQRIIYRSGFLGLRKEQLPLAELSSLEIQKSGGLGGQEISILSVDGSELVIRGYAKAKYLAAEIEALAKATV
ncbi:MAG: PH domain-containing protein [Rhodoluna sp.]